LFGHQASLLTLHFAAFKYGEVRDASHTISLGQCGLLFGVDL
jgi:hypothetical protein